MTTPKRIKTGIQVPKSGQLKPSYTRAIERMYERMKELTPNDFDVVLKVVPKSTKRNTLKIKKT